MKIYCVVGVSNAGKTRTLNEVSQQIGKKYSSSPRILNQRRTKDILHVYDKVNNQKVGIESQGDNDQQIMISLQTLIVQERCDIVFCACRSKGKTYQAVHSWQSKGHIIHFEQGGRKINSPAQLAGKLINLAGL